MLSAQTWDDYILNKTFEKSIYFVVEFDLFFFPILWYPIVGNYCLVSSLQLLYRLGRDEGRESCVLRNTTQPSRTAS